MTREQAAKLWDISLDLYKAKERLAALISELSDEYDKVIEDECEIETGTYISNEYKRALLDDVDLRQAEILEDIEKVAAFRSALEELMFDMSDLSCRN